MLISSINSIPQTNLFVKPPAEQGAERKKMTRYRARMTNRKKHIFAECYTLALLQQWIIDNEKLGFKLIGKIQKL